jgi:hypothetical protein
LAAEEVKVKAAAAEDGWSDLENTMPPPASNPEATDPDEKKKLKYVQLLLEQETMSMLDRDMWRLSLSLPTSATQKLMDVEAMEKKQDALKKGIKNMVRECIFAIGEGGSV